MDYLQVLTNRYAIALGVPFIFLFSGALAKKIVRKKSWSRKDFYLGIELALAAMSASLIHIFELLDQLAIPTIDPLVVYNKLAATAFFVAVTFFLLLFLLSTHQDWETRNDHKYQAWVLGVGSNAIGIGLLSSFILIIKVR